MKSQTAKETVRQGLGIEGMRVVLDAMIVVQGVLCFGCGGLCRGKDHTSLKPLERHTQGNIVYALQTPVCFRPDRLVIYGAGSAIVKSLRIGNSEQLVKKGVPLPLFFCGRPVEEVVESQDRSFLNPSSLVFDAINKAVGVIVEVTEPVDDILLIGRHITA